MPEVSDALSGDLFEKAKPLFDLVGQAKIFLAALPDADLIDIHDQLSISTYVADEEWTRDLYRHLDAVLGLLKRELDRRAEPFQRRIPRRAPEHPDVPY